MANEIISMVEYVDLVDDDTTEYDLQMQPEEEQLVLPGILEPLVLPGVPK